MPITSDDIPNGSIMTEAMVSWYIAKYSVTRSGAIAAIRLLENGSGTIPTDLDSAIFSSIISSYYQNRGSVSQEASKNELSKGQADDNQVLVSDKSKPAGFKYLNLAALITALGSLAITASLALTGHFSASSISVAGGISAATTTISGESSLAGTTISGNVTSSALVYNKIISFTSVTTSQTLCSYQNTTGADRVIPDFAMLYATNTATGGSYRFTVSQSATANATGTGADLYFDGFVDVPTDGLSNLVPTSTISGVIDGSVTSSARQVIHKAGNYINVLIASPTSTLTGTCRIPSF